MCSALWFGRYALRGRCIVPNLSGVGVGVNLYQKSGVYPLRGGVGYPERVSAFLCVWVASLKNFYIFYKMLKKSLVYLANF